jgi:hypothetical protein
MNSVKIFGKGSKCTNQTINKFNLTDESKMGRFFEKGVGTFGKIDR